MKIANTHYAEVVVKLSNIIKSLTTVLEYYGDLTVLHSVSSAFDMVLPDCEKLHAYLNTIQFVLPGGGQYLDESSVVEMIKLLNKERTEQSEERKAEEIP